MPDRTTCLRAVSWLVTCFVVPGPHVLAQDRPAQPRLSQVVAEGIGRRFPPGPSPLALDKWHLPLHAAPGNMMTVALSPDGTLVATGCGHDTASGELVLWDTTTGRERFVRRYPRGVRTVIFSNDGRWLATGSFDGIARLIDVETGRVLRTFEKHTMPLNGIALTPDYGHLITGSHDETIVLWDLSDGSVVRTLTGHQGQVLTVAVSPDGTLLASGGRDNTVRLWDLQTGELLRTLQGHQDLVEMVAFSPDGSRVASAGWDGMVRLWETATGREIAALPRGTRVSSVAFSPDGMRLVSSGWDAQLVFWDMQALQVAKQFVAHNNTSYAAAFSSDGAAIASCGFDGVAKLWTVEGELLQTFTRQPNPDAASPVQAAAWSPDEAFIATAHANGSICVTRVESGEVVHTRKLSGATGSALAFSTDGKSVICGTTSGSVDSWNPFAEQDELDVTLLTLHEGRAISLALTADGSRVVSCGNDGSLRAIEIESRRSVTALDAGAPTQAAAFDPAHYLLATAHADGRLRFWDLRAGREMAGDVKLPAPPTRLAFDPTGRTLATAAGAEGRVWSLTHARGAVTLSEPRVLRSSGSLKPAEGEFLALVFSPGAPGLVTGDSAGTVRVWGPSGLSGQPVARKLPTPVSAIAVSPRTGTVLAASLDGMAWLWPPDRNRPDIRPLAAVPHERGARHVAITPDGRQMLTDGYDGRVRLWELATGEHQEVLGGTNSASACALAPGGTRAAVGHSGRRVQTVQLETGDKERNYPGLPRAPYELAFSPDRTRPAVVLYQHGVWLYDLTSLEDDPVAAVAPDALPFTWAEFSPDGRTFATCTGDWQQRTLPGKVRLHDAKDATVLREFEGHTEEVKSVTFDPQGARLAATSADKTTQVWNVRTGERLAVLPHETGVFTAAFVPDSDLLITADYHGCVSLWDLSTTERVQRVPCHTDMLGRVSLSADQSVLATASRDGLVSLWALAGTGNDLRIVDAGPREQTPLAPE